MATAAVSLVGCGERTPAAPSASSAITATTATISPGTELAALATVLEIGTEGPELCLGGVADSYPPQCGGPKIKGWSWDQAPKSEQAIGVRWGSYALVGTYDGTTFMMTRPATTAEAFTGVRRPGPVDPALTTPCNAPDGGWRVVDPAMTSMDTLEQAGRVADGLPDAAGTFLDQSINTADMNAHPELANDPTKLVFNARVTDDLDRARTAIRKVWGGALCVSKVQHSNAQLTSVQDQLRSYPGMLGVGPGAENAVELQVILDDGSVQQAMDAKFGPGLVRVTSALFPFRSR